MPVPTWDKYKPDRWDIDFTNFCRRHGMWTDTYGDCLGCLEEEPMKKSFNQKLREFEDRSLRNYLDSFDKEPDPRGETEEEYLAWREREEAKIEEWEEKRRGR